jgi:Flp pilus assembly protein TadD
MRPFMDVIKEAGGYHKAGQFEQAAFLYENLLGAVPNDAVLLFLYGTLCSQVQRFGSAITFLKRSVELAPELNEAWHNLGVALRNEGHGEEARQAYGRAISLDPDNPDLMAMMAGSFINEGEPEKALAWAEKALAIDPDQIHGINHKALALLELGRFSEAWEPYRARFALPNLSASPRPYECPEWDGKPVKKLAIHGEQGLGDEVMFMSCWPDIAGLADEIVIECEGRMVDLFKRSFGDNVYRCHVDLITAHPDVDAYIPMGNLPGLFRNSSEDFARAKPFLKPNPAKVKKFRKRLEKLGPGPYIGLGWHGGTKGTHQEMRNAPLELWGQLVKSPGTFISLQYGDEAADQARDMGIKHWGKAVEDLDDFAALIAACDLVISVCQTAIHFAGGLGKECWCITPSKPAWRYGIHGNMDWYPSVDLIRQQGDDWGSAFMEVAGRLQSRDEMSK